MILWRNIIQKIGQEIWILAVRENMQSRIKLLFFQPTFVSALKKRPTLLPHADPQKQQPKNIRCMFHSDPKNKSSARLCWTLCTCQPWLLPRTDSRLCPAISKPRQEGWVKGQRWKALQPFCSDLPCLHFWSSSGIWVSVELKPCPSLTSAFLPTVRGIGGSCSDPADSPAAHIWVNTAVTSHTACLLSQHYIRPPWYYPCWSVTPWFSLHSLLPVCPCHWLALSSNPWGFIIQWN